MDIQITGVEEACRMLDELPPRVVKQAFARALTAACVPIVRELEVRTPESVKAATSDQYGKLKADIRTDIQIDASGKGALAQIWFAKKDYVARFVEYGHRLLSHGHSKDSRKELGNVQPHPFIRPAAAAGADAAVEAFSETLNDFVRSEYGA